MDKVTYTIWDKKSPINGQPAEEFINGNRQFKDQIVFLAHYEHNPHQILHICSHLGTHYRLGDEVEDTAQRFVDTLNEQNEGIEDLMHFVRHGNCDIVGYEEEGCDRVYFNETQLYAIQGMINRGIQKALELMTEEINVRINTKLITPTLTIDELPRFQ